MIILGSQTILEPEGDAPDWTYEELIDTFVVGYAVRWLEHKLRLGSRGIIDLDSTECCHLIVELRGSSLDSSAYLTHEQFYDLHPHRYWLIDKDGLREIDHATYQEISADPVLTNQMGFEKKKFCFENGFHTILSSFSKVGGGYQMRRNYIVRDGDGKLDVSKSIMLATS